jgi:hypothetical protein
MSNEQFDRERKYQIMLSVAAEMLKNGVITANEFAIIDTKMREKYRPILGSLCREMTLLF